jgi:hypothetical protein
MTTMKMKYIFISLLAALCALTSCSVNDLPAPIPEPEPTVTPAEAVIGDWIVQMEAGGIMNDVIYDSYVLYIVFQSDGHGLYQQYFLNGGNLVAHYGNMTDYVVDDEGNISIFVNGSKIQLGDNIHFSDGHVYADVSHLWLYGLELSNLTEDQEFLIFEWGVSDDKWEESGDADDDEDTTNTDVTEEGAEEPPRARK